MANELITIERLSYYKQLHDSKVATDQEIEDLFDAIADQSNVSFTNIN